MKSYSSREVIKMLKADGWYEVNVVGSHHQYKHPTKKGRTTIKHPDRDIPLPTLKRIEEQSGLNFWLPWLPPDIDELRRFPL